MRPDAAGYVLGILEPGERAEAERLLADDAAFRAEVERLAPTADRLASLPDAVWAPAEPPPLAFAAPTGPSLDRAPGPLAPRRRARVPVLAAAAAVLLLAGLVTVLLTGDDAPPTAARAFELRDARGGDQRARARLFAGATPRMELSARLRPTRPGRFYSVSVRARGEQAVPVGSFGVSRSGRRDVTVPLPVPPARVQGVDVERDGRPVLSSARRTPWLALRPVGRRRGASGRVLVGRGGGGGRIQLEVRLPHAGEGRFYAVWLLNTTRDAIALGSLEVGRDRRARVVLPVPAAAGRFRRLDVSLERNDGDPRHSGRSVLRSGSLR
jgi:anti-sigma-K factor RskA